MRDILVSHNKVLLFTNSLNVSCAGLYSYGLGVPEIADHIVTAWAEATGGKAKLAKK